MSEVGKRSVRKMGRRVIETCSMGAWVLLAATPVIVVVCAIHG